MVDAKIRDLTQITTPAATDSYVIADSATTNKYINHSDLIKLWTAQVDANSNNLINVGYVESNATNPASVGTVRLGNNEGIYWRNAGNTADLSLQVDTNDRYVFGSGEATISSGNGNLILSRFGVTKIFIGTATTTITNDTTFNNNVTIVQRINGQSGAYIESDADGYEFEAGTGNFFEYKINNVDEYIFDATALTMQNNNLEMGTGYINITSDATGDLMKHDGTGFTRFARGTANQQLRVNAGGTDLEWFTPASAGSSLPARVTFLSTNTAEAWLNQPSGETEIFGDTNLRHTFNATNATQARVTATITSAGQTGAVITPQYSTNQGGAWNELASTTGQLDLAIDATGTTSTSLVDIAAGAQTDIWIRFVGTGGNNMTDPNFTVLTLEFET
jgi:hypothetical protein